MVFYKKLRNYLVSPRPSKLMRKKLQALIMEN